MGQIPYPGDRKSLELCLESKYLLYDQPQLDWQTGSLAGVKVILGVYSPELGWIHRHRCIPIAEKTGLIFPEEQMDFRASLLAISAVASSRTNSA
ncbi:MULTISPECIES: hypothetical protein [unclassified Microcoleus]|uniref:hypothetical protein n=1 Tax=unclassified Microcoleus TaxID=2642155 RepID=UPI002FCEF31E